MSDPNRETTIQAQEEYDAIKDDTAAPASQEQIDWQTPVLEDVSEQVMAQPYIRFT